VIATYNDGNLRAIPVHKNQTIDELVVAVQYPTPDNIAAVAQSPSWEIYYGGFSIYKLGTVKSNMHPTMFPVQINLTSGINISDMRVISKEKSIIPNVTTVGSEDRVLYMKLPKYLIDEKASVSVETFERSNKTNSINGESSVSYHLTPDFVSKETLVSIKLRG
jgi:hypothetical protein